jgi:relaxase-like protein
MAFSYFAIGKGESEEYLIYVLRLLVLDAIERLRNFMSAWNADRKRAWLRQSKAESEERDRTFNKIIKDIIFSEDFPLLCWNIPEYALDLDSAIRALTAELLGGGSHLESEISLVKAGLTIEEAVQFRAEELAATLVSLAAIDKQKIRQASKRMRSSEPSSRVKRSREYYELLISLGRNLPHREFKSIVREIIEERFPNARIVGYVHTDAPHFHMHMWISAVTTTGRKLHINKVKGLSDPEGEWINTFKTIDETVVRVIGERLGDPSILEDHLNKKREWEEFKLKYNVSIKERKRPPVMPFRERHLYDSLGEAKQRAERRKLADLGQEERETSNRKKAAPVARSKNTHAAMELWGKVKHISALIDDLRRTMEGLRADEQSISFLISDRNWSLRDVAEARERLKSLVVLDKAQREVISAEREAQGRELNEVEVQIRNELTKMAERCELALEEHGLSYSQHKAALDKTIENRKGNKFPPLKYALHNARQISEMEGIARRWRDADLRLYVHDYQLLDTPTDREGITKLVDTAWSDLIKAETDVYEDALYLINHLSGGHSYDDAASRYVDRRIHINSRIRETDPDKRIIQDLLSSPWEPGEVAVIFGSIHDERAAYRARRFVKAIKYRAAARKILKDYKSNGVQVPTALTMDGQEVARIRKLVGNPGALIHKATRGVLCGVIDLATRQEEFPEERAKRLLEACLQPEAQRVKSWLRDQQRDDTVARVDDSRKKAQREIAEQIPLFEKAITARETTQPRVYTPAPLAHDTQWLEASSRLTENAIERTYAQFIVAHFEFEASKAKSASYDASSQFKSWMIDSEHPLGFRLWSLVDLRYAIANREANAEQARDVISDMELVIGEGRARFRKEEEECERRLMHLSTALREVMKAQEVDSARAIAPAFTCEEIRALEECAGITRDCALIRFVCLMKFDRSPEFAQRRANPREVAAKVSLLEARRRAEAAEWSQRNWRNGHIPPELFEAVNVHKPILDEESISSSYYLQSVRNLRASFGAPSPPRAHEGPWHIYLKREAIEIGRYERDVSDATWSKYSAELNKCLVDTTVIDMIRPEAVPGPQHPLQVTPTPMLPQSEIKISVEEIYASLKDAHFAEEASGRGAYFTNLTHYKTFKESRQALELQETNERDLAQAVAHEHWLSQEFTLTKPDQDYERNTQEFSDPHAARDRSDQRPR